MRDVVFLHNELFFAAAQKKYGFFPRKKTKKNMYNL